MDSPKVMPTVKTSVFDTTFAAVLRPVMKEPSIIVAVRVRVGAGWPCGS